MCIRDSYDTVAANILSTVLIRLSPTLRSLTGHRLILSGILEKQVHEVIKAYTTWIQLTPVDETSGWFLLSGEL